MPTVPARVAGEITIRLGDLSEIALEAIKASLTFENEEKTKASMLKTFGWWDLPDVVLGYRVERRRSGDEVICLPRGFSMSLVSGLEGLGYTIEWEDHRSLSPAAPGYFKQFVLRDYQLDAALDLLRYQQGFYKAPAGSGKTVTALGTMAYANQRTLVIVDKAGLLEQWRTRAAQFYDMPMVYGDDGELVGASLEGDRVPGKIGEDVWEERDLTICLRQTLWSRLWQLDATSWWQGWGAVWFDEGHHLSAETTGEVCKRVTSVYMNGISATPAASPVRGQIIHSLIGPIIHETPRKILIERGILMGASVEIQTTSFTADFWQDHDSAIDGTCEDPNCKKTTKHKHRNNYASVLKKLVEDEDRCRLIVDRIMKEPDHFHLVPSRQLKHLNLIKRELEERGWPKNKIWHLRGEENAAGKSQEISQEIGMADCCVLLATVADEGLDIPCLDRVHMIFPMKQELSVIQIVGRVERVAEGKTDAIIVDYCDPGCIVFGWQFEERIATYTGQEYPIAYASAIPEANDCITYIDEPETNKRTYLHEGCGAWIVPMDDVPPPIEGEIMECAECAAQFPVYPTAVTA